MGLTPYRGGKPAPLSGLNTEAEQALEFLTTTHTLTPAEEHAAALTVCETARDLAEARVLLEMLGLAEPRTPSPVRTRKDGTRKQYKRQRADDQRLPHDVHFHQLKGRDVETLRPDDRL